VRSKTVIALVVLLVLAVAVPAAAAGDSDVRLATQAANREEELQVRPATVSFTGDGTGYLGGRTTSPGHYDRGGIEWLSWGETSAFGRGYAWLNDCRPYCAAGHFHKHRMTVRAFRPRDGLFTRMTIVYRFGGREVHDRRVLERAGGYWFWGI
jgi:hypothetical protein